MRLLLDQGVYAVTALLLRNLGHAVFTAAEAGLAQATDAELLQAAEEQQRILVTRDRDFGGLVFVTRAGSGVIYLRLHPATPGSVHSELERVLDRYSEEQLRRAFVVIEPGRHRFRDLL